MKERTKTIICFRNTGYNVLSDAWYNSRKINPDEEKRRIVQLAADIIRENLRSQIHEPTDTYRPADQTFLHDCENQIPDSLKCLLEGMYFPLQGPDLASRGHRAKESVGVPADHVRREGAASPKNLFSFFFLLLVEASKRALLVEPPNLGLSLPSLLTLR